MKRITIYSKTANELKTAAAAIGRTETNLASLLIEDGLKAIAEGRIVVDSAPAKTVNIELPADLIAAIKTHTDAAGLSVAEYATAILEGAVEDAEDLIRAIWVFDEAAA